MVVHTFFSKTCSCETSCASFSVPTQISCATTTNYFFDEIKLKMDKNKTKARLYIVSFSFHKSNILANPNENDVTKNIICNLTYVKASKNTVSTIEHFIIIWKLNTPKNVNEWSINWCYSLKMHPVAFPIMCLHLINLKLVSHVLLSLSLKGND